MSDSEVTEILNKHKVIAVVGLSNQLGKPSHRVAAYMKQHGYKIIPVNPTIQEALGEKSYKNLLDIPQAIQRTIDVVDIFRRSEDVPPIVEQAIQLKLKLGRPFVVWMQLDIKNEQAAQAARQAGIVVVMDKCIMKEPSIDALKSFRQHTTVKGYRCGRRSTSPPIPLASQPDTLDT